MQGRIISLENCELNGDEFSNLNYSITSKLFWEYYIGFTNNRKWDLTFPGISRVHFRASVCYSPAEYS